VTPGRGDDLDLFVTFYSTSTISFGPAHGPWGSWVSLESLGGSVHPHILSFVRWPREYTYYVRNFNLVGEEDNWA
jgi:hypothetical protein